MGADSLAAVWAGPPSPPALLQFVVLRTYIVHLHSLILRLCVAIQLLFRSESKVDGRVTSWGEDEVAHSMRIPASSSGYK
jgi:hypothetical protein